MKEEYIHISPKNSIDDYFSNSTLHMYETRKHKCIQQPGDLIYVPDKWHHMTINEEPSISFGGRNEASAMADFTYS